MCATPESPRLRCRSKKRTENYLWLLPNREEFCFRCLFLSLSTLPQEPALMVFDQMPVEDLSITFISFPIRYEMGKGDMQTRRLYLALILIVCILMTLRPDAFLTNHNARGEGLSITLTRNSVTKTYTLINVSDYIGETDFERIHRCLG